MKTSKKAALGITLVVVLALIAAVAVWGRNYYQNRYVSANYYAMVPLDYDVSPVMQYSDGGKHEMGLGVEYKLTAYSADGEAKEVEFTVYDSSSEFNHGEKLPQPGDYLLVKASKQIVTGWSKTAKDQIPAGALAKIEGK